MSEKIMEKQLKILDFIVELLLYTVAVVLTGVVFLFYSKTISILIVAPFVLIFPMILWLGYKQKGRALLHLLLPVISYISIWVYLSSRSWWEKTQINIASSIAKTNGFGLLRSSGYSTTPRLIFLGVCGAFLSILYSFCFVGKIKKRWFYSAVILILIVSLFVFKEYIKLAR